MAFLVEMAFGGKQLVQDANNHPDIRLFTTRKLTAAQPLAELGQDTNAGEWVGGVQLPWSVSSNASISDDGGRLQLGDDNWLYMSAVCYLFGKQLQHALRVPVGLINTNWGGTVIQDWCPAAALADCAKPQPHKLGVPTHLYNAMVSPLLNHTIKGVVWYQGESNGGQPQLYSCLLPAMIRHWRTAWAAGSGTDPTFSFGVVQLAGDVGTDPLALPRFRWLGQTQGSGTLPNIHIPNSFLATAYDLGDSGSPYGSVHCRYKQEVSDRLARGALKLAYGQRKSHSGPVLQSVEVDSINNTAVKLLLKFSDTGTAGLALSAMNISKRYNQTQWTGKTPFEVCYLPNASHAVEESTACGAMSGFDGWSTPSTTELLQGGDTIRLGGMHTVPAAVRYAWRGYPCEHLGCGVYSAVEGIPPPPFHSMVHTWNW